MTDELSAARSLQRWLFLVFVACAMLVSIDCLGQTSTPKAGSNSQSSTSIYIRGADGRAERIVERMPDGSQRTILPLHGHNGSVIGAVDEDGRVVEEVDYEAFGLPSQTAGLRQKHQFQGEYWDEDAQLLYLRDRWYDPRSGLFLSADSYEGKRHDPKSLNRYAFGHNDPVHNRDPSGQMSIGELGAVSDIQSVLGNLQASSGLDLMSRAIDRNDDTGGGWAALASIAPLAVAPLFKGGLKIASSMKGNGKVAYSTNKVPLSKEIDAAEFIASRKSAGVYIRGGSSTKGADFFISGVKWELKTLESPTSNAVKNNIRTAKKQADKVIIDGRVAGLTEAEANRTIARLAGSGDKLPSEIMFLLKDGKILHWP